MSLIGWTLRLEEDLLSEKLWGGLSYPAQKNRGLGFFGVLSAVKVFLSHLRTLVSAWAACPGAGCCCSYAHGNSKGRVAQNWRTVLVTACRYLEDSRTLYAALVCRRRRVDSCELEPPTEVRERMLRGTSDNEELFGLRGESKLIVSLSLGSFAEFMCKPQCCSSGQMGSCWLGHCDLLVMDGACQDEFFHCASPRFVGNG